MLLVQTEERRAAGVTATRPLHAGPAGAARKGDQLLQGGGQVALQSIQARVSHGHLGRGDFQRMQ